MGIIEIGVIEMVTPILRFFVYEVLSSITRIRGLKGFWEQTIFSLDFEPEGLSSL